MSDKHIECSQVTPLDSVAMTSVLTVGEYVVHGSVWSSHHYETCVAHGHGFHGNDESLALKLLYCQTHKMIL